MARSGMTYLLLTARLLRRTGDTSGLARMEHVRISGVMLVFLVVNGRYDVLHCRRCEILALLRELWSSMR